MNKHKSYIINEANGDRDAGAFSTYEAACAAIAHNYSEADFERYQPSVGLVRKDGTVTYDF